MESTPLTGPAEMLVCLLVLAGVGGFIWFGLWLGRKAKDKPEESSRGGPPMDFGFYHGHIPSARPDHFDEQESSASSQHGAPTHSVRVTVTPPVDVTISRPIDPKPKDLKE